MTDFTNIDLKKLPSVADLAIKENWNSLQSYTWVLETLIDYYLGIANVEGKGWLADNWWRVEKEIILKGTIALVYYGKQFLIADIIKLEKNFEQKITAFEIRFLGDNQIRKVVNGEELKKETDKMKKNRGDVELKNTVIFRNNPFEQGDFKGLSNETKKMDILLELVRHNLEMTKDTLLIKTKSKLGTKAENDITQGLAKGKIVNIYYEDKRTKQPVNPANYDYEMQEGDVKQRQQYWADYDKILEKIYEKYKIRHIEQADKFSRTNNPEVYSNLALYWAWEQQRGQVRKQGINEFMEKFPTEGKFNLKYGFVFGKSEEAEEVKEEAKESKKDKFKEKREEKFVSIPKK